MLVVITTFLNGPLVFLPLLYVWFCGSFQIDWDCMSYSEKGNSGLEVVMGMTYLRFQTNYFGSEWERISYKLDSYALLFCYSVIMNAIDKFL